MNQALVTALQVERSEKNIIILVPYLTPEDDIISSCEEFIEAAKASKIAREAAVAQQAIEGDNTSATETETQEIADGSNEPN